MTNQEAVNWIINITADIGKSEYRSLWHYEQALSEIRELLEDGVQPQRMRGRWENADHYDYAQCSLCGYAVTIYDDFDYCPKCGAGMLHD